MDTITLIQLISAVLGIVAIIFGVIRWFRNTNIWEGSAHKKQKEQEVIKYLEKGITDNLRLSERINRGLIGFVDRYVMPLDRSKVQSGDMDIWDPALDRVDPILVTFDTKKHQTTVKGFWWSRIWQRYRKPGLSDGNPNRGESVEPRAGNLVDLASYVNWLRTRQIGDKRFRLLILGRPQSGKTWAQIYLCIDAARRKLQSPSRNLSHGIPLLCEITRLEPSPCPDLLSYLEKQLAGMECPFLSQDLQSDMQKGRYLLLFDFNGNNETAAVDFYQKVNECVNLHSRNQYICTCTAEIYERINEHIFNDFEIVRLSRLDKGRLKSILQQRVENKDKANDMWRTLESNGIDDVLCTFPRLVDRVLPTVIQDYDIQPHRIYRSAFGEDDFLKWLAGNLAETGSSPSLEAAKKELAKLETSQRFLYRHVRNKDGVEVCFSHDKVKAYFMSLYLKDIWQNNRDISKYVDNTECWEGILLLGSMISMDEQEAYLNHLAIARGGIKGQLLAAWCATINNYVSLS